MGCTRHSTVMLFGVASRDFRVYGVGSGFGPLGKVRSADIAG